MRCSSLYPFGDQESSPSRSVPRLVGIFVAIAGAGYVIDSFGSHFASSYDLKIASFTFIGEVVLMAWGLVFVISS